MRASDGDEGEGESRSGTGPPFNVLGYVRLAASLSLADRRTEAARQVAIIRSTLDAWQLHRHRLWRVVEEVEVWKRGTAARPELAKILAHLAADDRAGLCGVPMMLVIPIFAGLENDHAALLRLERSGLPIYTCDQPELEHADLVRLLSQRRRRSMGTRRGMGAASARGVKLGNPNGKANLLPGPTAATLAGLKASVAANAERMRTAVRAIQQRGITSANGIATALNQEGLAGPRGGRWEAGGVGRLLRQLDKNAADPVLGLERFAEEGSREELDRLLRPPPPRMRRPRKPAPKRRVRKVKLVPREA